MFNDKEAKSVQEGMRELLQQVQLRAAGDMGQLRGLFLLRQPQKPPHRRSQMPLIRLNFTTIVNFDR